MPEKTTIGVPTMRGIGSAFGDYGVGVLAGGIYGIAQSIFGSGIIGSLAAPVIAGSALKGPRGTAISTIAGFHAAASLLGNLGGLLGGGAATGRGEM